METMLLLVLFMMNSDETSREKMKNFLNFYRENRPLITAIMQAQSGEIPENPQHIAQNTAEEAEKNRPPQEVGDPSVLEEYLRRFSV